MPKPITVPRLGWSMEEGTFAGWLKAPDDVVRAGDMVFVLEGDKAQHEIESFDTGRLCVPPDAPRPGATVRVGEVIGFLLADGESAPASVMASPASRTATGGPDAPLASPRDAHRNPALPRAAGPDARRRARRLGIDLDTIATPDPTGRVLPDDVIRAAGTGSAPVATPRARRRARELGLDWRTIRGSGRDGRIRERDLATHAGAAAEPVPVAPGTHRPATSLRRSIARRMAAGVHRAAPVTLTTKLDAEALVTLRMQLKAAAADGPAPGYGDIIVHTCARVLREQAALNACWYRDGIHTFDAVHVAIAVDTPAGLLAPVIRDADRLTLTQIANRARLLVERARGGALGADDLGGGTFTVSNLGASGIDAFTPILNLPQAAILGIGRIVAEPVVRHGTVVAGRSLTLSLTFDHRVVDGAPAARWLDTLARRLATAATSADGH